MRPPCLQALKEPKQPTWKVFNVECKTVFNNSVENIHFKTRQHLALKPSHSTMNPIRENKNNATGTFSERNKKMCPTKHYWNEVERRKRHTFHYFCSCFPKILFFFLPPCALKRTPGSMLQYRACDETNHRSLPKCILWPSEKRSKSGSRRQ